MASKTAVSQMAGRYGAALFELADEQRALDAVADDLRGLLQACDESAELMRLIRSPVLKRSEQGRALAAVLDAAGAHDLTKKFLGVLAANRRLFALSQVVKAFLAELARRRGEVTAEVTSARSLSEAHLDALREALQSALGGKVSVTHDVDPALIGGLVVRVGSRMVDTSLKTQLSKMAFAMKGAS